jgi:hypothetical protein
MTKTTETLNQLVASFATEDEKFIAGNASAAARARKVLQEIIALAKTRRTEITEEKNARKADKAGA